MPQFRFRPALPRRAPSGTTNPDRAAFRAWHDTTGRFVPFRAELEAMLPSPPAADDARA